MFKKVLSVLLFVIMLSGLASAMEFSADTVMTTKEGKMTGRMYFKADRFRMDMNTNGKQGNGNMSTITRMDKKVIWSIMPPQKMYMEMPFNQQNRPKVEEKMEGEIERKQVGSENIDGHPTKKYLITYTNSGKGKEQMYQWLATDINFPVKTASIDGGWVQEYKNIKMGSQANDLFEVPAGYKKMQLPSGMNFNRR